MAVVVGTVDSGIGERFTFSNSDSTACGALRKSCCDGGSDSGFGGGERRVVLVRARGENRKGSAGAVGLLVALCSRTRQVSPGLDIRHCAVMMQ